MRAKIWKYIMVYAVVLVLLVSFVPEYNVYAAHDYSKSVSCNNGRKSDIYVKITRYKGGSRDWQEYGFSIKNNTDETIKAITITIPVEGEVRDFQCWGISAKYTDGEIIITHKQAIEPGETFKSTEHQKFGFGGGALLSDPEAEEGEAVTSTDGLKCSVTGKVVKMPYSMTPVGMNGKLSVKKVSKYKAPTIVNEDGKPLQLKTVSTHGVQWYPEYVNKEAFQSLRDEWGINAVRLAIYPREGGYLQGKQAEMDEKIQEGVRAARELGMYVIIDWHVLSYNPNDDRDEAKEFFKKYARMYKKYDNVIFEICNEPTNTQWYNGSDNDLYTYCKEVCEVIRDCGNDSIIICGTNDWSQRIDEVASKPLKDDGFENIMYSVHFYSATHYDNIKNYLKTAIDDKTPVFASEFSCCDASGNGAYDFSNADDWMSIFKENNISYACWSLCNKSEAASLIKSDCSDLSGWTAEELTDVAVWFINTNHSKTTTFDTNNDGESDSDNDKTDKNDAAQTSSSKGTKQRAELTISSDWGNGMSVNAVVKNNSNSVLSGWRVEFDIDAEISSIWCAKIVSHKGNHYVIEPESFNSDVNAKSEITFGFNAEKSSGQTGEITNVELK